MLTQFCEHRRCRPHVVRPSPLEEMHTSRLLCEFENPSDAASVGII